MVKRATSTAQRSQPKDTIGTTQVVLDGRLSLDGRATAALTNDNEHPLRCWRPPRWPRRLGWQRSCGGPASGVDRVCSAPEVIRVGSLPWVVLRRILRQRTLHHTPVASRKLRCIFSAAHVCSILSLQRHKLPPNSHSTRATARERRYKSKVAQTATTQPNEAHTHTV